MRDFQKTHNIEVGADRQFKDSRTQSSTPELLCCAYILVSLYCVSLCNHSFISVAGWSLHCVSGMACEGREAHVDTDDEAYEGVEVIEQEQQQRKTKSTQADMLMGAFQKGMDVMKFQTEQNFKAQSARAE